MTRWSFFNHLDQLITTDKVGKKTLAIPKDNKKDSPFKNPFLIFSAFHSCLDNLI
jgi:hypothetical protein